MIDTTENNPYLAEFEEFEPRAEAGRASWLKSIREAAIERFLGLGFPSTRTEEWRFTSVAPIAQVPFKLAGYESSRLAASYDLANFTFGESDCCQLVFVNGTYSAKLSSWKSAPSGLKVKSLTSALHSDQELVQAHLTRYASFEKNAFVALNTAFLDDGAFVFLPPRTVCSGVIHLLFVTTAHIVPTVMHPRILIVSSPGSQATIVESHVGLEDGSCFNNAVTEIVAAENSIIDYYRLQRENESALHMSTVEVAQERGSNFSAHSISLGGALARNDFRVVLGAEGAECMLNGLYVIKGRQHVDNHTSIEHVKPHCTSRELYKGILDGKSSAVFDGKILVHKDAQKTNSKQTNKNLLLSEEALVNSTPRLEIFADDVKCTHGATIGQLNEDELFYLRSRGIDAETARTLLTYAFASDILNTVRIKPIQCQMDLLLLARLSRAGAADMRQFAE